MKIGVHDVVGGLLALILVVGVFVLLALGQEVPGEVWTAMSTALMYVFARGIPGSIEVPMRVRSIADVQMTSTGYVAHGVIPPSDHM